MYVATLEPTEVTVTVALFAEVAPPKFAPTTVTVSLTLKPVPAAFMAAVYVPFVFVTLNVALAPAKEELPVTAVKVRILSKATVALLVTAPFTIAVAVLLSSDTAVALDTAPFTVDVAVWYSVTVAVSIFLAVTTLPEDTTFIANTSPPPGTLVVLNLS